MRRAGKRSDSCSRRSVPRERYIRRDRPRRKEVAARGDAGRIRLSCPRMSFIKKHAFAVMFAAGLSHTVALSQSPPPQTQSSLSRNPAQVSDWANRLLAKDPKIRATAEAALA